MTIGSCFLGFGRKKKNAQKEITLAIFGIDNAGKTTTTKSIRGDSLEVCPTMGFDLIEFSLDSYNVSMYDIGGSGNLRSIWNNYFSEIHGLIYVVDSSDADRLDETRSTLAGLLQNELIQGKPVLLLANKQDSTDAMDEAEIVSSLRLSELACANRCPCRLERSVANIGTGAKMDRGIKIGLRWLLQFISFNWTELDARVRVDKAAKATADAEEALARKERVRRRREERERQEAAEAAAAAAAAGADDPEIIDADEGKVAKAKSTKAKSRPSAADVAEKERLGEEAEAEEESSANRRRANRSSSRRSRLELDDVDGEEPPPPRGTVGEGDGDGDGSSRSRRHHRRSHHRDDDVGGEDPGERRRDRNRDNNAAKSAADYPDGEGDSDGEERRKSSAKKKSPTAKGGRRHRRLAPLEGELEGEGEGEDRPEARSKNRSRRSPKATPTELFEVTGGGGEGSDKSSRLPPLRGGINQQPNTDDGDYVT